MSFPMVSFIGESRSGKTTLLEGLVAELSGRGLKVAVAKRTHHGGFELDRPGKDSWRFSEAGASCVLLDSAAQVALIEKVDGSWPLRRLASLAEGRFDVLLAEGFREAGVPAVQVCREDAPPPASPPANCVAVVSDVPLTWSVPRFGTGHLSELADFVLTSLTHFDPSAPLETESHSGLAPKVGHKDPRFDALFEKAVATHGHVCAGQALGVRMAIRACDDLGIGLPDTQKRLIVYVEIDRCASDAIASATGCRLGKRTLKFVDYGKMAATFVDTKSGQALRVVARDDARERARQYVTGEMADDEAQTEAYQRMPDDELMVVRPVSVAVPRDDLPGGTHHRVSCEGCGEGINSGREIHQNGRVLCRACASGSYYSELP